jgi:hypothetical protein
MVLNLEKIVPSPYFRSYWVQQNITDLKSYAAAVSDMFRSGSEYREERVLLKKAPAADGTGAQDVSSTGESAADFSKSDRPMPRTDIGLDGSATPLDSSRPRGRKAS